MIKVSNMKTDVYGITLHSLKEVENLENNFETLEDLQEYVRDITNTELVLESKTIRILGKMELKKIKKII